MQRISLQSSQTDREQQEGGGEWVVGKSRETHQKAGKARERERHNQEISSEKQSQEGENQGE